MLEMFLGASRDTWKSMFSFTFSKVSAVPSAWFITLLDRPHLLQLYNNKIRYFPTTTNGGRYLDAACSRLFAPPPFHLQAGTRGVTKHLGEDRYPATTIHHTSGVLEYIM